MKKTPHQFDTACTSRQDKGFSLVEVLVAMVVLSIGLLGLAGLQTAGLKANNSAYQRSQANIMANDILDRMRANRVGIAAGYYDDPYESTPSDPGCVTSGCTVDEMADYDVFLWETSLGNTLPGGRGAISGDGTGSVFTITVMWDDNRIGTKANGDPLGTDCSGDPTVDLTCFVMSTRI
jgi:type IV pilus assembly protein PilV